MPKLIYNINNFSGGLNNNTNPRDMSESEAQVLLNLSNEIPGKLVVEGRSAVQSVSSNTVTGIDALNYGNGLLHVNLDRNLGTTATLSETEYMFINDTTDSIVRIYNITDNTDETGALNVIDYGSTSSRVEMYVIDGEVRVVPHYSDSTSNKPMVFGYYNYDRYLGHASDTDLGTEADNRYKALPLHIAPLKGSGTYDYNIESLYTKQSQFQPTYGSEVFMYNVESSDFISTGDKDILNITGSSLNTLLSAYDNNSDDYDVAGEGSMAVFAYFKNKTTGDPNSNIPITQGKRYGLFVSKVYSNYNNDPNKQESVAVYIGDVYQESTANDVNEIMHLGLIGRMGGNEDNYSGFNIYYALMDDFVKGSSIDSASKIGVKYLLAEVDFSKGLRLSGTDAWEAFDIKQIGATTSTKQFCYPDDVWETEFTQIHGKEISALSIKEPYIIEGPSVIGEAKTGFKTSTVLNRRVYAGNVQYYDKNHNLLTKSDRVLKSLPNKFDYFPEDSFIDVEVEDGDTIIKLESLGNKLLQFKRNKLFIINVSRDIEFLEAEYEHKGCEKDYHVVKGEGFVAWFNEYGAYIYDGQQVIDINLSQIAQPKLANWATDYYDDNNVIGYLPKSKELIIVNKNSTILLYDLKSESWRESNTFTNRDITNLININNGDLYWWYSVAGLMGNPDTIQLVKWNKSPQAITGSQVIYKSKELDMGSPTANKNFNTIYINYKEGEDVMLQGFGTKRDATALGLTDIGLLSSGGDKTTKISLDSTFNNLVSFGIALKQEDSLNPSNPGNLNANFEVNDIQIVYREKVTR